MKNILIVLLFIQGCFIPPLLCAKETHVMLLNSYHQSMLWEEDIYRAIKEVLPKENRLHVENMDTKRIPYDSHYEKYLYNTYKHKYLNNKPDLIISSDNNAFDFLRKYHDELFTGIPVVFCGVNFFNAAQIADHPLFTGVEEMFDVKATLDSALVLHPKTEHVFVINDFLPTGKAWAATIKEELKDYQVNVSFAGEWSMETLLQHIEQLPEHSLAILGPYFRDSTGQFFTTEESVKLFSATSVPIYALLDFNLGHGVVGGNLISGFYQGKTAAEIANRILKGEQVKNIPVLKKGANRFMFDYQQLDRFDLLDKPLPKNSIIINEPYSFYAEYKLLVWLVISFISILSLIIILLLMNVMKRKQIEKALHHAHESLEKNFALVAQQNKELAEMDRLKDEFLANTSHELRTPLNGIIGIAESLVAGATGKLDKKTSANLLMIAQSGKRLATLINDILDFSKLKHHEIELQLKPLSLHSIVKVVTNLNQALASQKNLVLINNITSGLPAVYADENRLQQILYNLLGNAMKFTEQGNITLSAEIIDNKEMKVSIKDEGIGIAEEKLATIFKSFEQAEGSISRQYGGTGLGLAVTKKLVSLHGGKIWVESCLGMGSTFIFTLPLSKEQEETVAPPVLPDELSPVVNEIQAPSFYEEIQTIAPYSGNASKILIVDDEPVNLQVLHNYLSLQNYSILHAGSGQEALKFIEEGFRPDVILLDVMMPHMTGYEVTHTLRKKWQAIEMPILLLTAKNQVQDLVQGLEAGANDYMTKPISKEELLARVKTHLSLKTLTADNLRMSTELDIARQLQQMVLPKTSELQAIAELDIAGCMKPADEVGGDYYDVLVHNGHIKIGIGDVTGHGLESGVLMLMVQTAIRTLLLADIETPEQFLNIVNAVIYQNIQRMETDKNLSLSLLDYHAGVLKITGQHEELLWVRQNGHVEVIDTFDLGFTIGLESDISAYVSHLDITLQAGEGLVLYTDGITEALNVDKKEYGLTQFCNVISRHWSGSAVQVKEAIMDDLSNYIQTQTVFDDITLLVIKQR